MSRLAALAGLAFVVSTFAFAETEIIVTASRIEEDARSTPAYVRVISDEAIARGDTVLDALAALPDIAIKESSPGKEYISMGAFGENGFARTLVMIDGRPVNRPDMASVNWRTIPLDRIERIEVVKGPLSSQYGDQAIAGAVNIITRDPGGFDAYVRAGAAANASNSQAAGASWGGESFQVSGSFNRNDLRPTRDRSDSTVTGFAADAALLFGESRISAGAGFSGAGYQLPGGLDEGQFNTDPDTALNQDDEVQEQNLSASLTLDTRAGDMALSVPVSWRRTDSVVDLASWGSWTNVLLDDIRGTVQADRTVFVGAETALVPIAGIDAAWSRITVDSYGEEERITLNSSEYSQRVDLAAWMRLKALLGDSWVLDGGGRLSVYEISAGSEQSLYTPLVYDLGMSWVPDGRWSVNARYGRVFRYPLLDEQASYYGFGPPGLNEDLEPEFGHHVTLSGAFRNRDLVLELAPYFLAMQNEIVYNPLTFQNENIGNTYHFGSVFSSGWTRGILGLNAAYSYDDARFADTGKTVPLVPRHTVTGRVSVRPVNMLELSTDARYSGSYYKGGDDANTEGLVDGRVGWDARIDFRPVNGLTIYAEVTNILDNRTPTTVYWSSFSGDESWYPTEGRVFDFGLNWQY
jgi:iron complex outermembrane receptor protein